MNLTEIRKHATSAHYGPCVGISASDLLRLVAVVESAMEVSDNVAAMRGPQCDVLVVQKCRVDALRAALAGVTR